MWHKHKKIKKTNRYCLKHCFYRPILTPAPVLLDRRGVAWHSKGSVAHLCYSITFKSTPPPDGHGLSALHESPDMLYMDHSALTFHTATVLCIKLPRQANKEGIYGAVKARAAGKRAGSQRNAVKVCRCSIKIGGGKKYG